MEGVRTVVHFCAIGKKPHRSLNVELPLAWVGTLLMLASLPAQDSRIWSTMIREGTRSLPLSSSGNPTAGDPVYPSNGELRIHKTDLSIPSVGMPFSFDRMYKSGLAYDGPLGHRWDFSFNMRLGPSGSDLVSAPGDGQFYTYAWSSHQNRWNGPAGAYDTITYASGLYTRSTPSGFKYIYEEVDSSSPGRARIKKWQDRNGREIEFLYTTTGPSGKLWKVIDTQSRTYTFTYDSNGRIYELADYGTSSPRKIRYLYSSAGDLTDVIELPGTSFERKTTYTYSSSTHLVLTITDPKENAKTSPVPFCRNYYNSTGHLIVQEYGPDASSDNSPAPTSNAFLFTYTPSSAAPTKTTFYDRGGSRIDFTFDSLGRVERKEFGSGSSPPTITYAYDSNNNLTLLTKPNGAKVATSYDGFGNVTQISNQDSSGGNALTWAYEYQSTFNLLTKATDPGGVQTTYAYDSNGNLTRTVESAQSSGLALATEFTYDSGQEYVLTRVKDPRGIYTNFDYDTNFRVTKVRADTGSGGQNLTVSESTYDQYGNVLTMKDANGNTTTLTVNALNQVTKTVSASPFLYEAEFFYDASDNLTKTYVENSGGTGSSGHVREMEYDILDNVTKASEQISNSVTRTHLYFYDVDDKLTKVRNPESEDTVYVYNEFDLNTEIKQAAGSSVEAVTKFEYDSNFRLTKRIEPKSTSHTTTFAYDHHDRLTRTTNAQGTYTETSFGSDHLADFATVYASGGGSALSEVKYFYDTGNRLTKTETLAKESAGGSNIGDGWVTSQTTYDAAGNVLTLVDENGNTTTFTYNSLGRLTQKLDALGNKLLYTYDASGNILTLQEEELVPGGSTAETFETTFEYDTLHRLTKVIDPASYAVTFDYDPRGNVLTTTDANGNKVFGTFDEANRMIQRDVQVAGSSVLTTLWVYDKADRLTRATDPKGYHTDFEYDDLGRQTKTTYPDSGEVTFTYDANSNLIERNDQNATAVTYGYDTLNRLVTKSISATETHIKGETTGKAFTYDALGRLTEATDTDSRVEFTWNTLGGVETETATYGANNLSNEASRTVAWDYDDQGRTTAVRYPGATTSAGELTYQYDALNRLTKVREGASGGPQDVATWDWRGPARVIKRTLGNGAFTEYGYDSRKQITSIAHKKTVSSVDKSIVEFAYTYDAAGRITGEGIKHFQNDGTQIEDGGFSYIYDKASRLTKAYRGVPAAQIGQDPPTNYSIKAEYNLDNNGNRTTVVRTPQGGSAHTDTYTVNNTNSITEVDWSTGPSSWVTENYEYDLAGSRTQWSAGLKTWSYDYQNRLVEVRENENEFVEYDHDVLGRRMEKRYAFDGQDWTARKRFYYAGSQLIQQYGVEVAGEDDVESLEFSYIYGLSNGEPLRLTIAGSPETKAYYHQSLRGDVYALTKTVSSAVNLHETQKYKEFGEITVYSGDQRSTPASEWSNPLLWRTQHHDAEVTSLVSGQSLYHESEGGYDPELGADLVRDCCDNCGGGHRHVESVRADPQDEVNPSGTPAELSSASAGYRPHVAGPDHSKFGPGPSKGKACNCCTCQCSNCGTGDWRFPPVRSRRPARPLCEGSSLLGKPFAFLPLDQLLSSPQTEGRTPTATDRDGDGYDDPVETGDPEDKVAHRNHSPHWLKRWLLQLLQEVKKFYAPLYGGAVGFSEKLKRSYLLLKGTASLLVGWILTSNGYVLDPWQGFQIPRTGDKWLEEQWGLVHAWNNAVLESQVGEAGALFIQGIFEILENTVIYPNEVDFMESWMDLTFYNHLGPPGKPDSRSSFQKAVMDVMSSPAGAAWKQSAAAGGARLKSLFW